MENPLISIVMPTYNQSPYIVEAIESVLCQDYPNKELLIIDGGSTDGTVDIIRSYEDRLAYWVSEPDSGQSEAFNKGFSRCKGDFLTWVNSDDILIPGALSRVARASARHPDISWFAGNCIRIDAEGKVIKCTMNEGWYWFLPKLGALNAYGPSTFFTRELLDKVGGVDETFHIMMDTDMWRRFYAAGHRFVRINAYLWAFRAHEQSKTCGTTLKDSPLSSPSHPIQIQTRQEYEWQAQRHGVRLGSLKARFGAFVSRALRVLSGRFLRGRIDTSKFRGKPWEECFHQPK